MSDINCDLGESIKFLESGHDESLMQYINSVNIACGFHAGDDYIMNKTVENSLKHGLKIGAHPGFNDNVNFGRINLELNENQIIDLRSVQLKSLKRLAGDQLVHIKPHGALYNMAAQREDYARAIAKGVFEFDSSLILYGLSGSKSISEAEIMGLKAYSEVFADRGYLENGSLSPRTTTGAVLKDKARIQEQIYAFVNSSTVKALDGSSIHLKAETICIHSDTENALEIAKLVFETVKK